MLDSLNDAWVRHHGPMKFLYVDGESGIAQPLESVAYLSRHGIQFRMRPPQAHLRLVDRRTAVLRDILTKLTLS